MARGGRDDKGWNTITGTNSPDILSGIGGIFELIGGKGDDTYIIDDTGDIVNEKNNGGTDHVISYVDYVLGSEVENLTLLGDAVTGTGNDSANIIIGNAENNTLYGLGGDDTLDGGDGSDVIDGGDGDDTAVFAGLSSDYTIERDGNHIRITSVIGEIDVLRNVEFLSFSNGIIAVSDIGDNPDDQPAPQAIDDADNTIEDSAVVISVLGNDIGQGLSITIANDGAKGVVTANEDGTVTYQPNANAFGTDNFTYTISDSMGRTSTATVSINIADVNDVPIAAGDSYVAVADETFTSNGSVLDNDNDYDGDLLTVIGYQQTSQAGGSVQMNADGTFTYTAVNGFTGTDTFTYTVTDGNGGQAIAAVTIDVETPPPPPDPEALPYYVEGLIYGDPHRLNYPDEFGSAVVVTYAFLEAVPDYYSADHSVRDGFTAFSAQQMEVTHDILTLIESFTNITFVETSADQAGLTFGLADLPGLDGVAYRPLGNGVAHTASDVWLDAAYASNTFEAGTVEYTTLLHELGHALGLDHSSLPAAEENQQYTIMDALPHPTLAEWVSGYQLYDVAALQHLYGVDSDHASGDDVYVSAQLADSSVVLWDTGGLDLIDLSNSEYSVQIDLNDGAFSTVAISGANNVAIGYGTIIEDVTGSVHSDILTGNDQANRIEGGPGDDILTGAGGNDIFAYSLVWGADIITDFVQGEDLIDMSQTGLSNSDIAFTNDGGNIVLTYGTGSITVLGLSSVDEGDLLFA
jgi:hypothetical protein